MERILKRGEKIFTTYQNICKVAFFKSEKCIHFLYGTFAMNCYGHDGWPSGMISASVDYKI